MGWSAWQRLGKRKQRARRTRRTTWPWQKRPNLFSRVPSRTGGSRAWSRSARTCGQPSPTCERARLVVQTEEGREHAEHALRLCTALFWYWYWYVYSREGWSFLEQALTMRKWVDSSLQARTLSAAGGLLWQLYDMEPSTGADQGEPGTDPGNWVIQQALRTLSCC